MIRVIRYVEANEERVTEEGRSHELDGAEHDEPSRSTHTWAELQAHASFPLEEASIDEETRQTALGRLDCIRYTL